MEGADVMTDELVVAGGLVEEDGAGAGTDVVSSSWAEKELSAGRGGCASVAGGRGGCTTSAEGEQTGGGGEESKWGDFE